MDKPCVFCDRTKFEERLIYEGNNFRIISTLGQITDGGCVLLAPKAHLPCAGAIHESASEELEMLAKSLCAIIAYEYNKPVTIFECGIVGQTIGHAHLHFLPAYINLNSRIRHDFPETQIQKLSSFKNLSNYYRRQPEPYLLWITKNEPLHVCWNPDARPQYLRIIAAEILGRPERADCRTMDAGLDKKLWSETVKRLMPYFI